MQVGLSKIELARTIHSTQPNLKPTWSNESSGQRQVCYLKSYSDGSSGRSRLPRIDQPNPTKPCHLRSYLCCLCSDLYLYWWRSRNLWQRSSRISITAASPNFNQNQLNPWKSNFIQSVDTLWLTASLPSYLLIGSSRVQVEPKPNST